MTSPFATLVSHNAHVHRAMRRMFATTAAAAASGDTSPELVEAVRRALAVLTAHHRYEDELLVPKLAVRAEDWDAVFAAHDEIAELVARIEAACDRDPAGLAPLLARLAEVLDAHLDLEEAHLTEALWRDLFDEPAARAFGKEVARHSRAHLQPAGDLLPVLLYNLEPAEREDFTARMPRFIPGVLVPLMWRARWRRLRPYLAYPPRRLSPLR